MYQITNRLTKPMKPQLVDVRLLNKLKKLKKKKNIKKISQTGGSNNTNNTTENDIFMFIEDNIYYIFFLIIFTLGLYYRYKMVQEERQKLLKNNKK